MGWRNPQNRGAIETFTDVPNGAGAKADAKTKRCIRCGSHAHWVRDCTEPYRGKLNPAFRQYLVDEGVMFANQSQPSEPTPPEVAPTPATGSESTIPLSSPDPSPHNHYGSTSGYMG